MQVILRKDMDSLGKVGDVVTVKPGYARNYLIPRGIAFTATSSSLSRLEHEKKMLQLADLKERRKAGDLRAKLDGMRLIKSMLVGEEDKMFGSVTAQDLADLIRERGVELDKRKIMIEEPIKHLGEFDVTIRLHRDVMVNVKLDVVKGG